MNLDWGLDVHNPQIPDHLREKVHAALPIPFYYLDGLAARLSGVRDNQQSVYVRLHDGGNSDNLAAYSLIDNDFATILISDHAYDRHGEMLDLCDLVNEMARREKAALRRSAGLWRHPSRLPAIRRPLGAGGTSVCGDAVAGRAGRVFIGAKNRFPDSRVALPVHRRLPV